MPIQDDLNTGEGRRGLTLASWNVCGLNNPIKKVKVFAHPKSLAPDLTFLPETKVEKGLVSD